MVPRCVPLIIFSVGGSAVNTPAISIRIGDADENNGAQLPASWPTPDSARRFLSSFAPHQPAEIYRLASLVSPLLASILDRIYVPTASVETRARVCRLYELIMDAKFDAYLDLLQIVAYHSSDARYSAMTLLANYWPEATGHLNRDASFTTLEKRQQETHGGAHQSTRARVRAMALSREQETGHYLR